MSHHQVLSREPAGLAPLFKVVEPCHQEELLQEKLRVQDGDVGSAANQGVGGVGQSVEHILADQPALFSLHKWLQEVVDHLSVHGTFSAKMRIVLVSPRMYVTYIFCS